MGINVTYKRRGLNITIIIQDEDWKKLGTFKYNDKDEKNKAKVIRTLKDAYGVSFKPTIDLDIGWLKGEDF